MSDVNWMYDFRENDHISFSNLSDSFWYAATKGRPAVVKALYPHFHTCIERFVCEDNIGMLEEVVEFTERRIVRYFQGGGINNDDIHDRVLELRGEIKGLRLMLDALKEHIAKEEDDDDDF